ncbi:choline ABC transporter substrate-binding protein [Halodurantibacterium flavum]|uniref:Choline ABC transporter substrate-binding protein n=1 Tax=Halodurantibacterium flavum TaxID=1382802 RepID=A0ABW4S620_9RHOB
MTFARALSGRRLSASALCLSVLLPLPAVAADPETCSTIRLSDPGWTDITATNAVAAVLLEGLGYTPEIRNLSVPIGYEAIRNGDIDVFLGNWMPAQQHFIDDLNAANAVEVLARNLEGAVFTLAVNPAGAELGVADFADLSDHADAFNRTIYGIEPGAPANENIRNMIESGDFDLSDWTLMESGEQAMLAQVQRNDRAGRPAVFLAWAPHPMNTAIDITYLSGGDDYFGPDYGGAEVFTLARTGWSDECPNAATFFGNLVFELEMENALMGAILDEGADPQDAARDWISENPAVLETWLDGVTTLSGEPGLPAVQGALGL